MQKARTHLLTEDAPEGLFGVFTVQKYNSLKIHILLKRCLSHHNNKDRSLDHGGTTNLNCPCSSPQDSCWGATGLVSSLKVHSCRHEFPSFSKKDRSGKNLPTEDVQRSDRKWRSGNRIPMLCADEMI